MGALGKYNKNNAINLNGSARLVNFQTQPDGTVQALDMGKTAGEAMKQATTPAVTTPATTTAPTVTAAATTTTPVAAPAATASATTTTTPASSPAGGDAMSRFAQILGKSPEEKAAEEDKLRRASLSRQAVMRFFDGLRYLGYSAGLNSSTPYTKFVDSSAPLQQSYQEAKADRQRMDAESAAYKLKVYEMQMREKQQQRQDMLDRMNEEDRELNRKRVEEADQRAREQREEEKNYNAEKIRYQKLVNDNLPQKQEDEHTVKTSQANRNNRAPSGGSRGGRGSGGTTAAQERQATTKEANQWARMYKREAAAYWRTYPRNQANEEAFNRMMRSRHAQGSSGGSGSGSKSVVKPGNSAN